jgi:hypothetical protein
LNGFVKYWYLLLAAMVLSSCASHDKALIVKQFYLRDERDAKDDEPMIRGEKNLLLYGAVSMEERKQRLGQYYTALWEDRAGAGSGEVEVVFEFQQGKTGSQIKRRTVKFDSSEVSGKAVFSVIGDDYFKSGRALAWKISVLRGGKVLDTKQSYLWE